jgi:hypothetical protein
MSKLKYKTKSLVICFTNDFRLILKYEDIERRGKESFEKKLSKKSQWSIRFYFVNIVMYYAAIQIDNIQYFVLRKIDC